METFLFLRYHFLLLLLPPFGARPRLTPKWMGQAVYLQPATLEYLTFTSIDDSRARKILGCAFCDSSQLVVWPETENLFFLDIVPNGERHNVFDILSMRCSRVIQVLFMA